MRAVGIFVLVCGMALAAGALYYSDQLFSSYEARLAAMRAKGEATTKLIVARERLEYGDVVTPDKVRLVEWPEQSIPPGPFTSPQEIFGEGDSQQRFVLRTIEPGEPVLQVKVTGFGEDGGVAFRLPDGKRAYSIPIDAVSGVSGFVSPGDSVDIILTERSDGQLTSRIILTGISVIALDQLASTAKQSGPRIARTVTVEVDARQAQILALAQQVGKLSLTLRGIAETGEANLEELAPINVDELIGREEAAPEVVEVKPTVRVRRGTDLQDVTIDKTEEEGETVETPTQ